MQHVTTLIIPNFPDIKHRMKNTPRRLILFNNSNDLCFFSVENIHNLVYQ